MMNLEEPSSRAALCLICNTRLGDPFQESEMLINRNLFLLETFCEYLETEGDCEILAKEFPFCGVCKVALVELKALDTDIKALFTRVYSIKLKLTAKILESQNGLLYSRGAGRKSRCHGGGGFGSHLEGLEDEQSVRFSDATFKEVTKLRKKICRRYDVAVNVKVPGSSGLYETEKKSREEECNGSWAADVDVDDFSPNELSDVDAAEEEVERLTRELTPLISDSRAASVETCTESENGPAEGEELPEVDTPEEISVATDVRKKNAEGDQRSSGDMNPGKEKELTDSDYSLSSEDSDNSEGSPGRTLRNRTIKSQNPKTEANSGSGKRISKNLTQIDPTKWIFADKYEIVNTDGRFTCTLCGVSRRGREKLIDHIRVAHLPNSRDPKCIKEEPPESAENSVSGDIPNGGNSGAEKDRMNLSNDSASGIKNAKRRKSKTRKGLRYKEVSPGKWLFDDKFPFEQDGTVFRCGSESCVDATFSGLDRVTTHCRTYHSRKPPDKRTRIRLKEIGDDKFVYGGKYRIDIVDGQFACSLCGHQQKDKRKVCGHIKKVHMFNKEPGMNEEQVSKANTSSLQSGMSREISPGHWMYHNRYPFVKVDNGFQCGTCSDIFRNYRDVLHHVRHIHFKPGLRKKQKMVELEPGQFLYANEFKIAFAEGVYSCLACGIKRKDKRKVCEHIKKVHMLKKDGVKVAKEETSSLQSGMSREISPGHWMYHNRYPFEKVDDGFQCGSCSGKFPDYRQVLYHVRKDHFKTGLRRKHKLVEVEPGQFLYANEFKVLLAEGRWKCITCDRTTRAKLKMLGHLRSVHINKIESFMCDVCGKVTKSRESFRLHNLTHDPCRQEIMCHVCGKSFKLKASLRKHLQMHDPKFECDICEKTFPTDIKLQGHRSIHTGEKRFTCYHCSESFRTYKGLCLHRAKKGHKELDEVSNVPIDEKASVSDAEVRIQVDFLTCDSQDAQDVVNEVVM